LCRKPADHKGSWDKLRASDRWSLTRSGVVVARRVRMGALLMMATSLPYLCIQVPAFALRRDNENRISAGEHNFALTGLIFCLMAFGGYLAYQVKVGHG
jgi:hypothetical protein